MNNNLIETFDEQSFIVLSDLSDLYLFSNKIKTISKNTFAPLKKLKRLYLSDNKIISIDENFFNTFNCLEELDLSKNELTHIPQIELNALNTLYSLDLRKNDILEKIGIGKLYSNNFDILKLYFMLDDSFYGKLYKFFKFFNKFIKIKNAKEDDRDWLLSFQNEMNDLEMNKEYKDLENSKNYDLEFIHEIENLESLKIFDLKFTDDITDNEKMDNFKKIKDRRNNYKRNKQDHRDEFIKRFKILFISCENKYNEILKRKNETKSN